VSPWKPDELLTHVSAHDVLLCPSLYTSQNTNVYIFRKQQQNDSEVKYRDSTHVLLLNTPHTFHAAGVSSGLATRVIVTLVSWGKLDEYYTDLIPCQVRGCCWLAF
jgi:hypothetical protein